MIDATKKRANKLRQSRSVVGREEDERRARRRPRWRAPFKVGSWLPQQQSVESGEMVADKGCLLRSDGDGDEE